MAFATNISWQFFKSRQNNYPHFGIKFPGNDGQPEPLGLTSNFQWHSELTAV